MDRNNLVYDPAAQMYRQNPLDPSGAAFGQMDGVSGAATDQQVEAGPQQNYPAWLTDLSARGLASDWKPADFVPTPADELHPRDIPPDAPVATPTAPMSTSTNAAPMAFGNGQEGGGDASNGAAAGSNTAEGPASADSEGGNGGAGNSAESGAADAGSDAGGADGFSRGGIVSPNKLVGPNPPGPDTGFGALKPGEGVLTDKAMKFYGKGIIAKLNRLAIAKEAFR